jgi:hypothetical protein
MSRFFLCVGFWAQRRSRGQGPGRRAETPGVWSPGPYGYGAVQRAGPHGAWGLASAWAWVWGLAWFPPPPPDIRGAHAHRQCRARISNCRSGHAVISRHKQRGRDQPRPTDFKVEHHSLRRSGGYASATKVPSGIWFPRCNKALALANSRGLGQIPGKRLDSLDPAIRKPSLVCDMAHWQLSPVEWAQRGPAGGTARGTSTPFWGREVRPCYPLNPDV